MKNYKVKKDLRTHCRCRLLEELRTVRTEQHHSVCKIQYFDKEQNGHCQAKRKIFYKENVHYNAEEDFMCVRWGKIEKTLESTRRTNSGYPQKLSHYKIKNCAGCPIQVRLSKFQRNWSIKRNQRLENYKEKIRKLLKSEEGIKKHKQRSIEVRTGVCPPEHCNGSMRFNLSLKRHFPTAERISY